MYLCTHTQGKICKDMHQRATTEPLEVRLSSFLNARLSIFSDFVQFTCTALVLMKGYFQKEKKRKVK